MSIDLKSEQRKLDVEMRKPSLDSGIQFCYFITPTHYLNFKVKLVFNEPILTKKVPYFNLLNKGKA